ncbi:hypothetical protein K2X85_08835 [bacterium]|nr:hypothetical protein [bacterium]
MTTAELLTNRVDIKLRLPTLRDAVILMVLAGILLYWRRETLFLPPYQDQAAGYWTEADFLADTSFDYHRLRYGVNHYMDLPPGPRSYMISIIPTMLALLMKIIPDATQQIVVVRCLSFLIGAGILWVVFTALFPAIGGIRAALVSLFVLSLPSFMVQIEILGMDPPLALLMTIGFICIAQENFKRASVWGSLAFFVKATGQLVSLVAITYIVGALVITSTGRDVQRKQRLWVGLLIHCAILAAQTAIISWGDTSASLLATFDWPMVLKPPVAILLLTPEIGMMIIVVAWLTVMRMPNFLVLPINQYWREIVIFWDSNRIVMVCWIAVLGMLVSSYLFIYTPRYFFCILPIFFITVAIELFFIRRHNYVYFPIIAIFAAFNFANVSGRFYPDVSTFFVTGFSQLSSLTPRLCVFTERSREYLKDHRSTIALIKQLEDHHSGTPVFAPIPYEFYLRNPALGYVSKPLNTFSATTLTEAMMGLKRLYSESDRSGGINHSLRPIMIYFGDSRLAVPRPTEDADWVYRDRLEPSLLAYRLHLPEESLRSERELEEWFLDETWSRDWMKDRLLKRADYLFRSGRLSRLEKEIEQVFIAYPNDQMLGTLRDTLRQSLQRQNANKPMP